MTKWIAGATAVAALGLAACRPDPSKAGASSAVTSDSTERKLAQYTTVRLTADLEKLTERERRMIPLLIDAARHMDAIYWRQAYGNGDSLLQSLADRNVRRYAEINYGPWNRLDDSAPFVPGVGPKPKGAAFYPQDLTKEELEVGAGKSSAKGKALRSQ